MLEHCFQQTKTENKKKKPNLEGTNKRTSTFEQENPIKPLKCVYLQRVLNDSAYYIKGKFL